MTPHRTDTKQFSRGTTARFRTRAPSRWLVGLGCLWAGLNASCPSIEDMPQARVPAEPLQPVAAPAAAMSVHLPPAPESQPQTPAVASPIASSDLEQIAAIVPQEPPPQEPSVAAALDEAQAELPPDSAQEPEAPSEPEPAEAADAVVADNDQPAAEDQQPDHTLIATAKQTWVYAKPSWKARKVGYLRAGAAVAREPKPTTRAGCAGGWYKIEPHGYVCVGKAATTEPYHPVREAVSRAADRSQPFPYPYVMSQYPPPPFYVRLPELEEQRTVERDLSSHLRKKHDMSAFEPLIGPVPGALLYERTLPALSGPEHGRSTLHTGVAVARSGFALVDVFEWTGRLFGVTTDLQLLPLDRTRLLKPSSHRGVELTGEQGLPAAFVRARSARQYRIDLDKRSVADAGPIAYRQGFELTGRKVRIGGHSYLETTAGTYVRDGSHVVTLPRISSLPQWAKNGRKWIDVSILRQALVAYEGTRAVYATLVSTGADGLGDPEKTHSTIQGAFLIHTKHVTATMDNDADGDVFDLRDVPYVQYFKDGYALHASYWHDEFGTPRSHGCINLAPADAAWLFAWTDPQVPEGWHGALELRSGTLVYIHP